MQKTADISFLTSKGKKIQTIDKNSSIERGKNSYFLRERLDEFQWNFWENETYDDIKRGKFVGKISR